MPAAFAAFVVWNGSIVVGDKANHEPAVHFMQPLYFVLFAALALAPVHFTPRRSAWQPRAPVMMCKGAN